MADKEILDRIDAATQQPKSGNRGTSGRYDPLLR
jgi:hypothetical protein